MDGKGATSVTELVPFCCSTSNRSCQGGGFIYDCETVDIDYMRHQRASLDSGAGFFITHSKLNNKNMENIGMSNIQEKFIETVKCCFSKLGLPVRKVFQEDSITCVDSEFNYADEPMGIRLLHDADDEVLAIVIAYGPVPKEKLSVVHELISRINTLIVVCKYVMEPDSGALMLQAGLCITDNILSEKDVLALLKRILSDNFKYGRLIEEQVNSASTPAEIMGKFLRDEIEPCKCFIRLEEEKCKLH